MSQELKVKLPLDINDIQKLIPHRYPFLLVDRVLEIIPNEYIVATKNVSISDPFLQGHFPGNPIVPGVLIVEGIAQASGVLGNACNESEFRTCLLTEIQSTRFRRQVIPGDTLRYEVRIKKHKGGFYWFDAEAKVEDQVAAIVSFSAMIK